jgi:hypothetical protein
MQLGNYFLCTGKKNPFWKDMRKTYKKEKEEMQKQLK